MQLERIKILDEIDRLNKERCDLCIDSLSHLEAVCECDATVKIRSLGKKLDNLTKPRNQEEENLLKSLSLEDMTREYFWLFKGAGMSDKYIREQIGTTEGRFDRWKMLNELTNRRSAGS